MAKIITATSQTTVRITGEANDCVIRAASNATGIKYENIHVIAKKHGRKDGQCCDMKVLLKTYRDIGIHLTGVTGTTSFADSAKFNAHQLMMDFKVYRGITLDRFLSIYNKGKYVCLIRGHAFAVVNGKVVDTGALRAGTRITAFFKVA